MRGLFALLVFCIITSQANAANLLVLNTVGKPPLNTPEQTGFMDRVTAEALRRIGYRMQTVALPAERGLRNVDAGIDDGEMSRVEGMEKLYPNLVRVPEKIMSWDFCVFTNKDIHFTGKWSDLKPYTVSFVNGWKILEEKVPLEAGVFTVKYPPQLFALLEKHRTDIVIYERWGGLQLVKTKGYSDIHILQPPLVMKDVYIFLNKKHRDLVPKLNQALLEMKHDGSYQEIYSETLAPLVKLSTVTNRQ
jgi:polar amino acid transport system substrate-binding protein